MNWVETAIEIARACNPKVMIQDKGDWPPFGRLFNLVLPDGQQTSITLGPGADLNAKIAEKLQQFARKP